MNRLFILLLVFLLASCGGGNSYAPVGSYGGYSKSKPPSVYKVKKGDTLYSISFRYGLDYKKVARINNIRAPYKIYVGQKIYFKRYKTNSTAKKSETKKPAQKTTNVTKQANYSKGALVWRWPTKGTVISTYSTTGTGRKGIKIAGKAGQTIQAAAAGKVVYSGNGLPRYGNLLIIKHNNVYLSAYAHNQTLLVKEGQQVKSGQKIATLGRSGTQRDQLHFEIRRDGKPVDPLRFLPKR
jgi:lipoprotein NlpD